ncbi:LytTR family DNA-binding domain-containing protein [Mucilaginibacter daejeonensis]|uniref:LytR/AlgR family response regulator transcription factor n=1 Tax=Mucilaginibacter daejeonensis TaxID=398049 RepID=UPI001D17971D|nr:LytTR family DNA-binding domain-containing protein [Mucilaginibacter daejeonensis]UEG54225.1 LytTR family DNA-binding domain-containing protein [Mucilaginibacter daejeonensis]
MIAIAVDDEPIALDVITAHAKKIPGLDLRATFLSATEALAYIKTDPVHLVFADIDMPGLNGLELAALVRQSMQVIFVTAYAQHALKGFDLAATDYLLKPISFKRFLQAYRQAETRLSVRDNSSHTLLVKDSTDLVRIDLDEIQYIKAEDNYAMIITNGKPILTRTTLNELQAELPPDRFVRIHRSYIVELPKIQKVERHQVTVGGQPLPLSRALRSDLLARFTL